MEKMSAFTKIKQVYVNNTTGMKKFFEDRQTFSVVTKFGFAVFASVCAVRSEYYGHGKLKYEDEDE